MVGDELYGKLRRILERDPDGWQVQPTLNDHANHKAWAIAVYGEEVWRIYSETSWNQPEV